MLDIISLLTASTKLHITLLYANMYLLLRAGLWETQNLHGKAKILSFNIFKNFKEFARRFKLYSTITNLAGAILTTNVLHTTFNYYL